MLVQFCPRWSRFLPFYSLRAAGAGVGLGAGVGVRAGVGGPASFRAGAVCGVGACDGVGGGAGSYSGTSPALPLISYSSHAL